MVHLLSLLETGHIMRAILTTHYFTETRVSRTYKLYYKNNQGWRLMVRLTTTIPERDNEASTTVVTECQKPSGVCSDRDERRLDASVAKTTRRDGAGKKAACCPPSSGR